MSPERKNKNSSGIMDEPVTGKKVTENIYLCEDGKYR